MEKRGIDMDAATFKEWIERSFSWDANMPLYVCTDKEQNTMHNTEIIYWYLSIVINDI